MLKITRKLVDIRGVKKEALVPIISNLYKIKRPTLIEYRLSISVRHIRKPIRWCSYRKIGLSIWGKPFIATSYHIYPKAIVWIGCEQSKQQKH